MRKFSIVIGGTEYPLNGENDIILSGVTGLGVTMSPAFAELSDGNFAQVNRKEAQGAINGTLTFTRSAYAAYEALMDALLPEDSCILKYTPIEGGTTYSRDVVFRSVTKTELNAFRHLSCGISFSPLSPWYTEQTLTGTGSVSVTSGGQLETGIIVRTSTPLTNPELTIVSDGVTVARASLTYETTGLFEYSNAPSDSHITDGGVDIISYVDASAPIFGRTRMAFTVTLAGAVMTVIVRKYWRTV